MHLNSIRFEPNSKYKAEGRHTMGAGAAVTYYDIRIETDNVGRVINYADSFSTDKSLADMWDYRKLENLGTGKIWDLRLFTAALDGSVYLAKEGLGQGADVNLRMKQGATALHWAAAKGQEELVKLFLDHGAHVNAVDDLGWMPAFLAQDNGFHAITKILVAHGAQTTCILQGKALKIVTDADSDPDYDLIEATEDGDFAAIKKALSAGADVNFLSPDGWTPLLVAAKLESRITELLLANGADPNIASDRGYTPLMRAAGLGKPENVRILLAAGADKDMVDLNGKNAYVLALEMSQFQCAAMVK